MRNDRKGTRGNTDHVKGGVCVCVCVSFEHCIQISYGNDIELLDKENNTN